LSPAHKEALARGRAEGRIVRQYLEALETNRRRGRPRSPETVKRRLAAIEEQIRTADPLRRLHLFQERANLEAELQRLDATDTLQRLEAEFVKVARGYGERKGLTYSAWRAAGVSPSVLHRAGITWARGGPGKGRAQGSARQRGGGAATARGATRGRAAKATTKRARKRA